MLVRKLNGCLSSMQRQIIFKFVDGKYRRKGFLEVFDGEKTWDFFKVFERKIHEQF